METWPRDRRSLYEVAAVVATGLIHLLFEELFHAKGPFIVVALIGWCSYLIAAVRRDAGARGYSGCVTCTGKTSAMTSRQENQRGES